MVLGYYPESHLRDTPPIQAIVIPADRRESRDHRLATRKPLAGDPGSPRFALWPG
jgi:hypothetical protein